MAKFAAYPRRGVTLLELLIVMTIIAMLVGLLLPAVQLVQQASRRTACDSNIHQLGIALAQYSDITRGWFPVPPVENCPSGWAVELLPFIEEIPLRNSFDTQSPFGTPRNMAAAYKRPALFMCPDTPYVASTIPGIEVTNYVIVIDKLERNRGPRRSWNIKEAAAGSRFPWCSSPELLPAEANYPLPHPSAFGF